MSINLLISAVILGFCLYVFFLTHDWKGKRKKREKAIANLAELYRQYRERVAEQSAPAPREDKPAPVLKTRHAWKPGIAAFYARHIEPRAVMLRRSGFLTAVHQLLEILDEHGGCPSVVKSGDDAEYRLVGGSEDAYQALSRVSLLEHSLNVAQELIEAVSRQSPDYEVSIGKWLVIALGHDIGKIPSFRKGAYARGDHALISRSVLDGLLDKRLPARNEILLAVRDHHYREAEAKATRLLREADAKARSREIRALFPEGHITLETIWTESARKAAERRGRDRPAGKTDGRPELVDLSWINRKEFLARIERRINVVEEGRFQAFSMRNGLVYVWLSTLSGTVRQMAKEAGRLPLLKEPSRNIELSVRRMLGEFIPDYIGEGYPGARFRMLDAKGQQLGVGLYLPIRAEAFDTGISNLEKRKQQKLLLVSKVEPILGKKRRNA